MFILYTTILVLGFTTSYTDTKYSLIKNNHLFLAAIFCLVGYAYLILSQEMALNTGLAWNLLIALGLGLSLYFTNTWGAGDAKLFILYCLLMPTKKYSHLLLFPSVSIFINIFLISTLGILFSSFDEILKNKSKILQKILSPSSFAELGKTFLIIFSIQWLIQDIIGKFFPQTAVLLSIIILFLIYRLALQKIKRLENNFLFLAIIGLGIGSRFLVYSLDFNISSFFTYLKITTIYTFFFQSLHIILNFNDNTDSRIKDISFAPFMFAGTLAANTNLLKWIIDFIKTVKT